MALDDMYKEVILDHYKNPRNKHDLPEAELSCTRNNPLCGDEITVFVHEDGDTIAQVAFMGAGCSISQSSASMMTEAVSGKKIDQAKALAAEFRGMMAGEVEPDEDGSRRPGRAQGRGEVPDPHQVRGARMGRAPGGARRRRDRKRFRSSLGLSL